MDTRTDQEDHGGTGGVKERRLAVGEVSSAIGRVRWRIRSGLFAEGLARLLVWFAAIVVLVGLLDVAMGLGAAVRLWTVVALGVWIVGVCVWLVVRMAMVSAARAAAKLDAALLEGDPSASGSEARTTLEMGEKIGASDLLSRTVARRVAQGAAERLDGMNLKRVRTGYQTGRALAVCAAVLMVAGAGQLLAGDVVGSVGKRLLDPAGGHPRWSPIAVSIDVERVDPSASDAKAGIWAGDSVRVSSVLAQMPEQTRAILMVQRPGRPLEPIPLDAQPVSLDGSTGDSLSGPHRAAALLRSVSEPARVWVELRGGPGTPERWRASSREIVIEAEQRPRLRGAEVIVTDPAYLGGRSRSVRLPGRTGLSERDLAMAQGGRLEVVARGSVELSEISLNARRVDTEQELRGMDGRIRWREMEPGERGREVG
ncbi:MAG: hypothetical protein ACNA8P_06845, partial [Phycisphaerales bacterium]